MNRADVHHPASRSATATPNIRSVKPLLAELHAHTTWSDGELPLPALVDLYGAHGFDVLCITDHVVRRRRGARYVDEDNWPEYRAAALANPNAGEVLVSATPGWEFVDLGGRDHAGGGSHGSLVEGDSIVPVLTVGIDAAPGRITDVAPALIAHATGATVV